MILGGKVVLSHCSANTFQRFQWFSLRMQCFAGTTLETPWPVRCFNLLMRLVLFGDRGESDLRPGFQLLDMTENEIPDAVVASVRTMRPRLLSFDRGLGRLFSNQSFTDFRCVSERASSGFSGSSMMVDRAPKGDLHRQASDIRVAVSLLGSHELVHGLSMR